jgi:hypothetical protein
VSESAKVRLIVVTTMLMGALSLAGQTRHSSQAQRRFALAVDRTFHNGVQANLPPHISTLLGLAQEEECPVRQNVERSGAAVRGIDVSAGDKNDVVLFVVDESANDQTLFLTSAQGRLRRVVSVKAGVGSVSRTTDENRKAFDDEKQFWADRLGRSNPAK